MCQKCIIQNTLKFNGCLSNLVSRAPSLAFPLNYGAIRKEGSREEIISCQAVADEVSEHIWAVRVCLRLGGTDY